MSELRRGLAPEDVLGVWAPAPDSRIAIGIDFHADGRALLCARVGGRHNATYAAMSVDRLPDAVAALVRELLSERDARNQGASG